MPIVHAALVLYKARSINMPINRRCSRRAKTCVLISYNCVQYKFSYAILHIYKTTSMYHLLSLSSYDKTRQDETRQGKTRQGAARQDKTRQDKTRQDKARQGKTRQNKTRQDKIRQGKPYFTSGRNNLQVAG